MEVPRRPDNPGCQRFHDCRTCSTERGRRGATCILTRFPPLSDTGHSACLQSAADLRRTSRNYPGPLDPAQRQGARAALACWEEDNLVTPMTKALKTPKRIPKLRWMLKASVLLQDPVRGEDHEPLHWCGVPRVAIRSVANSVSAP